MQKTDILKLHGWMLTEHNLKGNELIVFAICNMYQTATSDYLRLMAKRWLRAFPRTTVQDALNSLHSRQLISDELLATLKDLRHVPKVERKKRKVNPPSLEVILRRQERKALRRREKAAAPSPFSDPSPSQV